MGLMMTLTNIFEKSSLKNVIGKQVEEALKEAASSSVTNEREDREWRAITQRSIKTFKPMEQDKMFRVCYYLYDKNGIGHRIIERYKDFIVGDGLTYSSNDPEVFEVVDNHWNDPENLWEMKQSQKIGELGIYGEQFYPAFVNDHTGHVRLGYVDPEIVDKVLVDKNNAEKKISYTLKDSTGDGEPKTFKIIHVDENVDSPTYDFLVGDSFYFSINTVSNMPRGRSDLFPIADAIDSYENFLFNRSERADILTRIIYDLELQGKTDKQIKEILRDFHIPRSNEVHGHNEKSKLTITAPELGADDATNEAKLHFNHIMAGSGYPPHWFAGGEGLTRATAFAMDLPTRKQLKSRQKIFKGMVAFIFRYAIHQAVIAKKLKPEQKDTKVKINLPKIEEKETESAVRSLVGITNALVIGVEEGWVSKEQAEKVYVKALSDLGTEVEEIEKEKMKEAVDRKLRAIYMKKKKASMPDNPNKEEESDGD